MRIEEYKSTLFTCLCWRSNNNLLTLTSCRLPLYHSLTVLMTPAILCHVLLKFPMKSLMRMIVVVLAARPVTQT